MTAIIEVKNLKKTFKVKQRGKGFFNVLKSTFSFKHKLVTAVDNVSFSIKEGELVGFIGPNGAGKSTTLKMLTGILFPTNGSIRILGLNPQEERVKLSYKIGAIFGQKQQLLSHLPALDSFNLFSTIYELDKETYQKRLDHLVNVLEIAPYLNTPVKKLSLGERMRCELVAALLHHPSVIFLDEPTIGMDIIAKKNLRELIKKINKEEQTTIILTSHDLEDIEELCNRVIVINHGRIIYDGAMSKLKEKLHYKILEITFDQEIKQLPSIKYVKVLKKEQFFIKLQIDKKKIAVKKVLDVYTTKFDVADIVIEDPPIEEIIETLYKQ